MKKRLIHIFVLSCRRATFLIEKSQGRPLNIIDRIQLHFHLKLCDGCVQYQQQSRLIENMLKNDLDTLTAIQQLKLSEKSKSLIQKAIEENLKKK